MNAIKRLFTWLRPVVVIDKTLLTTLAPGDVALIRFSERMSRFERVHWRRRIRSAPGYRRGFVLVLENCAAVQFAPSLPAEKPVPAEAQTGLSINAADLALLETRCFAKYELPSGERPPVPMPAPDSTQTSGFRLPRLFAASDS